MMVQRRTYSITLRKAFKYLLGQGVHEQALLKGTELARRDLDDPYCQITENQARVFSGMSLRTPIRMVSAWK
jgi:hypothetical protein